MIRIIIADDHTMFRQGLIRLLQGNDDIEIIAECGDGRMALGTVRKFIPDVVVLDISMPVMDGLTAARRIIQGGLPTKIVVLTSHDAPHVRQQAAAAGAHAFVLKSEAFEQLLATIRAVAQSSEIMPFALRQTGEQTSDLTARERQVLRLAARGLTNRAISEEFCISIKTVDTHRTNMMRKLDLHSTAELVRYAFATGVI